MKYFPIFIRKNISDKCSIRPFQCICWKELPANTHSLIYSYNNKTLKQELTKGFFTGTFLLRECVKRNRK